MHKIAILILNYNGLSDTLDCLDSLSQINAKDFKHQIFIVDYGKDNQVKAIKSKFPDLQVFHQEKNLGFAGANNFLFAKAKSWQPDYYLLLNNDTLVSSDFLANLYDYLEHNSQVATVSPKIYFAQGHEFHKSKYSVQELGNVIWYAGGKIDWHNVYCSHIGVDEVDHGQFEQINDTDFFSGCCALIRAKALEAVGFFDPKYFLYWEDVDLSIRFQKAGWQIKYFQDSHIWHKNAGSSAVGSDLHNYFLNRNRLYFGFKYAKFRTKLALVRQSLAQLKTASKWEKQAIKDFYFAKMGVGSWES